MSLSLPAASLTNSRPGADIAVSNAKVSLQNIELKHLIRHLMERKTMFTGKGFVSVSVLGVCRGSLAKPMDWREF